VGKVYVRSAIESSGSSKDMIASCIWLHKTTGIAKVLGLCMTPVNQPSHQWPWIYASTWHAMGGPCCAMSTSRKCLHKKNLFTRMPNHTGRFPPSGMRSRVETAHAPVTVARPSPARVIAVPLSGRRKIMLLPV